MLAAAPSKVPFYVAGGVLAAWAVVLALRGITDSGFPRTKGASRLVILTSAVLVAAAMTTAVVTAGEEEESHAAEGGAAPKATGRTLALTADPSGALKFDKASAAVFSGRVEIDFQNASPVEHNVTIAKGSDVLGQTQTITGTSTRTPVRLEPGEYDFYCSVVGHRAAGMEGKLTVEQ